MLACYPYIHQYEEEGGVIPPPCPQPIMSMHLRRSLTNDEFQHRLQVALHEGTPNIAQTLVNGLNVRTGYTHAGMLNFVPFIVVSNLSLFFVDSFLK